MANNGVCDDGGPGANSSFCAFGTDCDDCKRVTEELGGKMVERQHPGCTGPHADLIVDRDVLKTSLEVKIIQVSITRFTMRCTMQHYLTFRLLH